MYQGIVRSRFEEALQRVNGFVVREMQPRGDQGGDGDNKAWVAAVSIDYSAPDGEGPLGAFQGELPAVADTMVEVRAVFTAVDMDGNRAPASSVLERTVGKIREAVRAAANGLADEGVCARWMWESVNVEFGGGDNPDRHDLTIVVTLEDR